MWSVGIVKEGRKLKVENMTSKWENTEQAEKIASNKIKHEADYDSLTLCQDLTSVVIANKAKPAVAAQAIAMMFGVAYRIACNNKMDQIDDLEIFNQMIKIAFLTDDEFKEWECQAEKVETKDDEGN